MDELKTLEVALRRDIDTLRSEAAGRPQSTVPERGRHVAIDVDAVRSLLARVIPSLEAGEVDEAALTALGDQLGAGKMRNLLDAVSDFDFTTAVCSARALMEGLSQPGAPDSSPAGAGCNVDEGKES